MVFILRKEKSPSEAETTDHMPEEGSISLMFTAEETRPVKSGWEIKSGGHIYMFVLPSVAVILFPTDTITSRFSSPPQMKESTWFFCRCRASAHRSGHTRKFNSSVHPPSGAQTFQTAEFPALLPSGLNEKVEVLTRANNMLLWRSCDKRRPLHRLWTLQLRTPATFPPSALRLARKISYAR